MACELGEQVSAATIDAALGSSHRVPVESTTIVAFHTASDHAHALARHLFGRIEGGSLAGSRSVRWGSSPGARRS